MKIVPSRIDASAEENEKINEKNNEDVKGKRSATTKRRIRFFLRINFFFAILTCFLLNLNLIQKM